MPQTNEHMDDVKKSTSRLSSSDKIIIGCLNIFLSYLKDVTVIKAFFIEENIQHLQDLFVKPQFAYYVSNVFKIGWDNGHFLGETEEERINYCNRIEELQIESFRNIIDILIKLFDDIRALQNLGLKETYSVKGELEFGNSFDIEKKHRNLFENRNKLNINHIL